MDDDNSLFRIFPPIEYLPTIPNSAQAPRPETSNVLKSEQTPASKPSIHATHTPLDCQNFSLGKQFSAFAYIHQPNMTLAEQTLLVNEYKYKDNEFWAMIQQRFGVGSVPARMLAGTEVNRGSVRISLIPRPGPFSETVDVMTFYGLKTVLKETISKHATVDELLYELRFRLSTLDELFKRRGKRLCLFSVGARECACAQEQVRDIIINGQLEYEWTTPEIDARKRTRIQPTSITS
jgi:hypothetical protein